MLTLDDDHIRDLAILHATSGLEGSDRVEYETWLRQATWRQLRLFAETTDLIAMTTNSQLQAVRPPERVKENLMRMIRDEEKSLAAKEAPSGFAFVGANEGVWRQLPAKGVRIKELSCSRRAGTATFLLELDAGARLPSHHHEGVEEAYLLHGDLHMCGQILQGGDYMRAETGSAHQNLYSEGGCRAILFTSLDNYPRQPMRVFDAMHRVWRKYRALLSK